MRSIEWEKAWNFIQELSGQGLLDNSGDAKPAPPADEKKPKFDVATWNKLVKGIYPTGRVVGQSSKPALPAPGDEERREMAKTLADLVYYAQRHEVKMLISVTEQERIKKIRALIQSPTVKHDVTVDQTLPEVMALERVEKWNGYWTFNMGDSPEDEQAMEMVKAALIQSPKVCVTREWVDTLLVALAKNARWDGKPDEVIKFNGGIAVGRGMIIEGARGTVIDKLREVGVEVKP